MRWSPGDMQALLVPFIWGLNFVVIKAALDEFPPMAFMAIRFAFASIVMITVLYWREGHVSLSRGVWFRLILLGLIGNTLYQVLFISGLAMTTATNSSLLLAATPVVVVLFGSLLGIEHNNWVVRVGVGLAFLGILSVLAAQGLDFSSETLQGDLLTVAAMLNWSAYTLGVRRLGIDVSALRVTTITMVCGTPGLILAGAGTISQVDWSQISVSAWAGLVYSALLALSFAYFLWNNSVQRVGGSRTAIFASSTPLVATSIAWITLDEQPLPLQMLGAGLIILGVLLAQGQIPQLIRAKWVKRGQQGAG